MTTEPTGRFPKEDRYCKECKATLHMSSQGHAKHRAMHERHGHANPPNDKPPEQQTTAMEAAPATTTNPLACPECAAWGIEKVFVNLSSRNSHRSKTHGIRGPNHKYYVSSRKKNQNREIVHAKEIHHSSDSKSIIAGQEVAALYAAGYVKGRLDSFAESSHVSSALFTQGVCELLLDSTSGSGQGGSPAMGPHMRIPHLRRHAP